MTLPEPCAPEDFRQHFRIDLAGCGDKADVLDRIARALRFPAWFGHNWDALADCLGDLAWLPASGYRITLFNAQDLQAAAPEEFDTLRDVLADAAVWWADEGVDFSVEFDSDADDSSSGDRAGT